MPDDVVVSVVLTVRNGVRTLPALLEDLGRLTWPRLEVVVVDAFSTDGTWDLLRAWRKEAPLPVVLEQHAGGVGAGRNRAVRLASGDLLAVTDADMRVPPDWIERLVAGLEEGVGVVGGPSEGGSTTYLARCTGALPVHGPSTGDVPMVGRNRFQDDFVTRTDIFAAVTCNCLYRRTAFEEAGGFDESLVATEDGELHHRILHAGHAIAYRRQAVVERLHRETLRGFARQMRHYAMGQAQANRRHPAMRRLRHRMPGLAALTWLGMGALAAAEPALWWLPTGAAGLALVAALAYGAKAAAVRRRPSLLPGVAFLFLVWQAMWALGYLEGTLGRGLGASHGA